MIRDSVEVENAKIYIAKMIISRTPKEDGVAMLDNICL